MGAGPQNPGQGNLFQEAENKTQSADGLVLVLLAWQWAPPKELHGTPLFIRASYDSGSMVGCAWSIQVDEWEWLWSLQGSSWGLAQSLCCGIIVSQGMSPGGTLERAKEVFGEPRSIPGKPRGVLEGSC